MNKYRWLLLLPLALLVLAALYVAARGPLLEWQKARLYAAGDSAIAAHDWEQARARFAALLALDPAYRDAQEKHEEALWGAIEHVAGGADWEAERALLRQIAASGEWALLAAMLDRCIVTVPAGEFLMGNDAGPRDERPLHPVTLDGYQIDRYEVTNAQLQRFVRETGREPPPHWSGDEYPPGQADYPAAGVTRDDAAAYCAWAGKRLPTEAEWEKACRGTDGRIYPWGDEWDPTRANVDPFEDDRSRHRAHTEPRIVGWGDDWAPLLVTPAGPGVPGLRPVGSYPAGASPYSAMDLVGGVSEWVADWYNWDGYWEVPDRNPLVLEPRWNRALRGSSWYPYNMVGQARDRSRCSARNSSHRGTPDARVGFRCARSSP
jgi:formylglycine-generating enzyme required for sulfatase activity